MDRWADTVLRVAYTWTGSVHDAQDICQTVLLKLLTSPRRFDEERLERAWVLRVAINESRDLLRDAFRSRSAPWEEVLSQQAQPVEEEYRELLRAALSLPPSTGTRCTSIIMRLPGR